MGEVRNGDQKVRKYFMAVRKFTNIFVLMLILMVGSRDTLFLVYFTLKNVRTDRQWLLPNVNRQKMNPPIITPVNFFLNKWAKYNYPIHKCVNELSITLI